MPVFQSKKYIPSSASSQLAVRYRASLSRHPFILFGLPFLFTIVAGSFFLTPATAIRYEKHDRKVRQMTEDERLGLKNTRGRKVSAESAAEEYYKLAAKDLDNWDQKRVKRLKGEIDGILE